ncbi:PLD nuclease N-terminal domain-containing protein [Williamsia sp. M5A3_1d]
MFPHYLEVAGWLALAALAFAWVAMAVYVTVDLARREAAHRSRWRWIAAIWFVPIVGVSVYLMATRRGTIT